MSGVTLQQHLDALGVEDSVITATKRNGALATDYRAVFGQAPDRSCVSCSKGGCAHCAGGQCQCWLQRPMQHCYCRVCGDYHEVVGISCPPCEHPDVPGLICYGTHCNNHRHPTAEETEVKKVDKEEKDVMHVPQPQQQQPLQEPPGSMDEKAPTSRVLVSRNPLMEKIKRKLLAECGRRRIPMDVNHRVIHGAAVMYSCTQCRLGKCGLCRGGACECYLTHTSSHGLCPHCAEYHDVMALGTCVHCVHEPGSFKCRGGVCKYAK